MDNGTLVTVLVVALVVVVLLLLIRAASGARRARPKLSPLPVEARERYVRDWDEIEAEVQSIQRLTPDIPAPTRSKDYFSGRDPAVEAIEAAIKPPAAVPHSW